jgi:ABC-type polysaccharide/polyol phosphate export permease
MLLAVYSVVFTTVFEPRVSGADPYPLFLFVGLLPWLFFSGALLDCALSLVDNAALLAKVVCPPEIFPAVTISSHLIHHLLALPVLICALAVAALAGWHPFPWTIALLPLALLPWVLTASGIGLAVAALAVHLADVRDLLANLLNLLFFASPIIYTLDGLPVPWLGQLLRLNPMAALVEVYRDLAFTGTLPGLEAWALAYLVGFVSWLIGVSIFGRLRDTLVEAA